MEYSNDKTYMVLAIITFLAFATALGFAYIEWQQLDDATNIVPRDIFP